MSDPAKSRARPSYIEARRTLEAGDPAARRELASAGDAEPEILYYLAGDEDCEIRRIVARNGATPRHADTILATDSDDEVRLELARKIARLLPDLGASDNLRLRERTIAVLETLARDSLPRVRAMLAEEIKQSDKVPKGLVRRLAEDVESAVACPILEYSPLLDDHDLRELIAAGLSGEALGAVARRERLGEAVADDISATLDIPAIAALLANPSAQIREDTLDRIIDQAEGVEALHRPLVMRTALSIRAMKRIAGFVASALMHRMLENNPLEETVAEELLERVRTRILAERVDEVEESRLADEAHDLFARGMLDDAMVEELVETNRRELLLQGLALMADLPVPAVRRIVASKSGRAVTALAWRAGLTMRTAFRLQTGFALVSPSQLMPARNGTDYPMDDSELEWQLGYFVD